jgi:hypothetical protein
MTTKPQKLIVDLAKGTQTYVDLTPDEINAREIASNEAATRKEIEQAEAAAVAALKISAKNKLLALGLTDDEIAAL